jgi:hypothetical protein
MSNGWTAFWRECALKRKCYREEEEEAMVREELEKDRGDEEWMGRGFGWGQESPKVDREEKPRNLGVQHRGWHY